MVHLPHTKKRRIVACAVILALLLAAAAGFLYAGVWPSGFAKTEDSFFGSPFLADKKVLVLIAHPDDEVNLAFGVIDAYVRAGSDVTVAFATNGDKQVPGTERAAEAVKADALLGVPKENIVLLGYGDYTVPPFFLRDPKQVVKSDAGFTKTYGGAGITDYHTLCFGEPAEYTRENIEGDIRQLILNLRPDVIFASDQDFHIDHVSVSQSFDRVMGALLRDNPDYRPAVFKGFCYDYAWFGNDDFYNFLTLQSALPQWNAAAYNTAFPWEERVRFPLPAEYLGYTLRSSKLRAVLLAFESQKAVTREGRLLNGDKLFWERRTDILWAQVTATSGNAALLQDFLLGDTMEAPLQNCWMPDPADKQPEIRFSWPAPQAVSELVFYDAPAPAGDILQVRITDDGGNNIDYTLPNGDGMPCRLKLDGRPTRSLTIRIVKSEGDPVGLSEIEVLPARNLTTQWIHLMDAEGNFIYEYPCPAGQAFTLPLYGYPSTPAQAAAVITKEGGSDPIAELSLDKNSFAIPPLQAGRYRIVVSGGGCTVEAVLRVGDSLLKERVWRFAERQINKIWPD
jgi:LmbE family N-acetylglucosaminyl deacetylase